MVVDTGTILDSPVIMIISSDFLSASDRRELLVCINSHREDHGVALRANALLLLDDGKSCAQVAEFLYLDDDTVRGWYKQYLAGRLAGCGL